MAYGTWFICKQRQKAILWGGNAYTESIRSHQKKKHMWMCMAICKLVLLKYEVAYN